MCGIDDSVDASTHKMRKKRCKETREKKQVVLRKMYFMKSVERAPFFFRAARALARSLRLNRFRFSFVERISVFFFCWLSFNFFLVRSHHFFEVPSQNSLFFASHLLFIPVTVRFGLVDGHVFVHFSIQLNSVWLDWAGYRLV